jgi:hypothetical protein
MKELQYSVLELFMSSNHYFNLLVLLVQLVLWVLWFRLGQLHLNFPLFWSCQAASHPVWIYGNGECRILDTLTGDLELE